MTCELIRVDFKKGKVKSREQLGDQAPAFNPYKDEGFKAFTAAMADLAVSTASEGGDPNRMMVVAVDGDALLMDGDLISDQEAIECFKRLVEKLEKAQSPTESGSSE